jgi:hypothetical protein
MVIGSRLDIFEFKESVAVRHNRAGIRLDRAFENDSRARNGVVVHIGYRADNNSGLRLGHIRQRNGCS